MSSEVLEQDTGRASTLQEVKAHIDQTILRIITQSMAIASIGGIIAYTALALMPDQSPAQRKARIIACLALISVSLISVFIGKRSNMRNAVAFFCTAGLLVAYASAIAIGSGIASSSATIPAAWIVVMGFLFGPRVGMMATRVAIGGVLALLGAQWTGLIPGLQASNMQPAGTYGVVMIMVFTLIGSTITQYSKLFWSAMQAIDGARNELQAKVRAQERAQEELLESKQRLTALLDHAPMSVLIFDKDSGRLHYANQNALQAHRATRVQDLYTLCTFPEAPYRAEDLVAHIHATRDQGSQQMQWRSRTVDGQDIWWAVKMDMLVIDDLPYVVSFGHDITTRLQAERALIDHRAHLEEQVRERTAEVTVQKRRIEAVIDALPVSLTIRDRVGRYQLSNRLFEEAAGMDKYELLGRTPHELFPGEIAEQFTDQDHDLLNGTRMLRFESSRLRLDGSRKDHLVTKVPLLNAQGTPEAILTLAVDISEQKAMQRELASAKTEAERLANVKSAFLANMSHEIRTPLHGMLGMAQVGEHLDASDKKQAREVFARITQSGRHLLGVINDILDFSKLDAGKLSVDEVAMDPRQVAQDALAMVEERGRDKGLQLTLHCEPTPAAVLGDALRTRQILINLLSNAVKFTEKGEVTLSLQVQDGQLHYAIQDTGIGMHADEQARVFSPFEQADTSTSRRFGGTGLGLSISRQLARLMGGEITLQSALGQGSTFTLTIPLRETDAPAPPTAAMTSASRTAEHRGPKLRGLRILAADDVDINRDILDGLLSQEGAEVHCCENGKEAIKLLRSKGHGYFDLVLMDVQMPVMNGLQATQLMQMIEPELPVVALTAHAMREECERCRDAGMVGHLAKPFETDELMQTILQYARRAPSPLPEPPAAAVALPAMAEAQATASAGSKPEDASPHAAHFDLAGALRRCAGKDALLRKLLGRFHDELPGFMGQCKGLLASDKDEARRTAHTLKGTAGNLGMGALSTLAGELEHAIKDGSDLAIAQALEAVAQSIAQHQGLMAAWLSEPALA